MRYFGAHVSSAGVLENAIKAGTELNINSIQIHPTAPQRWLTKPIDIENIEKLVSSQLDSPVKLIFAHGIYLANLAHSDKQKFHLGKLATVEYLNFMHSIDIIAKRLNSDLLAGGVVIHVGSALHYPTKREALKRASYGINWILGNSNGGDLILESAAGAGKVIGSELEDLTWLIENTEQQDRVHIGLDTQHMFASGYDWRNPEKVIQQLENTIDIKDIKIMHLNDSKTEFNSKKDRHENLGDGNIGETALRSLAQDSRLSHIPLILETPCLKKIETARIDVEKLRTWIG